MAAVILKIIAVICVLQFLNEEAVCQWCATTASEYDAPPLPSIPNHFSSDVIVSKSSENGLTGQKVEKMFVDSDRKIMAIEEGGDFKIGGKKTIVDHSRKQTMVVSKDKCEVTSIQNMVFNRLLPYGNNEFTSGNQLFRFGSKYGVVYRGNQTVMGEMLDIWTECLPALGEGDSFNINMSYYFRKPDSKYGQQLYGVAAFINETMVLMVQYLNMNNEKPLPQTLEVPNDIFCNMTSSNVSIPKFPPEFEMNIEILMLQNKTGFNARDYIDTREKYFRSDHHHKEGGIYVPVHEIHDFNTGISYTIDVNTYDCKVQPLNNRSWDAVETEDHHHIRMKTTNEFLGLENRKYIHEGFTTVRGIPVDVFSTLASGRRHPEQKSIQKWYFSRPDWKIGGMEGPLNDTRVPVMLTWNRGGRKSIMNFFNYDPIETTNHILWPLRTCYTNNRHYMYFRLDGKFDAYGIQNQRSITNAIRDALAGVAGISKLRVSSILIFKSNYGGVVAVRVYVLGLPPVKGTVLVLKPKHQLPLKTAVDRIRSSVQSGTLKVAVKVKVAGKVTVKSMVAQKDSYYDLYVDGPDPQPPRGAKSGKAGMSAGGVAALSITFIVIAVLLTLAVLHFVLRRRGVQLFRYARHSDDPAA